MHEMNLSRLIMASPFVRCRDRWRDLHDGLLDYFEDADLNNINIDDFIVNSMSNIEDEDYDISEHYIIYQDSDGSLWVV